MKSNISNYSRSNHGSRMIFANGQVINASMFGKCPNDKWDHYADFIELGSSETSTSIKKPHRKGIKGLLNKFVSDVSKFTKRRHH